MKKLTILCIASAKDETLDALRELGVLHVHHVQAPSGEPLDKARAHLQHVRRALEILPRDSQGTPSGQTAEEIVEDLWGLIHKRAQAEEALDQLRHERQRMAPYGNFDPAALGELRKNGVYIRLYQARLGEEADPGAGAMKVVLSEDKSHVYFAVVRYREPSQEHPIAGTVEFRLPGQSLAEVNRRFAEAEKQLAEVERGRQEYANEYPVVSRIVTQAEEAVEFLEARYGMGTTDPVAYLQGFCPAERVQMVREAAAREGWGIVEKDPDPSDRVPTQLKSAWWARPIQALYDMFGILPGYDEVDISPIFLVFFSIFFGMLIGDAGYGALFLAATIAARIKVKGFPAALYGLLMITSIATIAWGVLSGTYFGIASLPAPLARLRLDWLTDTTNVMEFCFFVGAIHLTIAHGWMAWRLRRSWQMLAQFGWIGSTWGMLFLARHLILTRDLPPVMLGILGAGVVAIALFMTPPKKLKEEWFNHAMLPLTIISNFVDIVSYVRLFAVGSATLAVASAFNDMAGGLMRGPITGLIGAVILFVGHSLNIVMAILGVMVHGVRLNTLEFSQHMEITWKGFAYRPFARRAAEADAMIREEISANSTP